MEGLEYINKSEIKARSLINYKYLFPKLYQYCCTFYFMALHSLYLYVSVIVKMLEQDSTLYINFL